MNKIYPENSNLKKVEVTTLILVKLDFEIRNINREKKVTFHKNKGPNSKKEHKNTKCPQTK